jgi:hypothetical protein
VWNQKVVAVCQYCGSFFPPPPHVSRAAVVLRQRIRIEGKLPHFYKVRVVTPCSLACAARVDARALVR